MIKPYKYVSSKRLLKLNIKYFLKHIIWSVKYHKYNSKKKNIFLLTSRRSGGTWLTEILSKREGTKFVLEPFNVGYTDLINKKHFGNEVITDGFPKYGSHQDIVINFFKKLLYSNSLKCQEQWRVFSEQFHWYTNQTLVKTHSPKIFIKSLLTEFPQEKFIYLVRNPMAQCLSILNKKDVVGRDYIQDFINDSVYIKEFLNSETLSISREIDKNGNKFDKLFISWILENLPILRILPNEKILFISYEELVLNKEKIAKKIETFLGEKLNIEFLNDNPSMTTSKESRKIIDSRDYNAIISRWKNEFKEIDLKRYQEILSLFNIDYYNLLD